MTDAQLIADHIARHGVTHCPPGATGMPVIETWQQARDRTHAVRVRAKRFEAARAKTARHAPVSTDEIIAMIERGKTPTQIASLCGMTRNAVKNRLLRRGIGASKLMEASHDA